MAYFVFVDSRTIFNLFYAENTVRKESYISPEITIFWKVVEIVKLFTLS